MLKRLIVLLVVCCLLVPMSAAQEERVQEEFLMTFVPNIQFAPLYVAVEKGYFTEAGAEISMSYLNEPDVIDLVAAGQANFGMASGEQVILAAAQARPIVYVYEWYQDYPIGIVVDAASGIETVADLAGLRVGLPGRFGASYSGLTALLLANGLMESDIDLQEIGYSAPDVFCLGGAIDAATVYTNNEPLQIQARADAGECGDISEIRVITVGSVADLVSNGFITSTSMIEEDPDYVSQIIAAFDQGLQDTINNPAEAYLLSASYIEGLPLSEAIESALTTLSEEQAAFLADEPTQEEIAASRDHMVEVLAESVDDPAELIQFQVLLASIDLWDTDQLGYSELSSWQNMQDTLIELGALAEPVALESLFSNDFLPTED
ncbi:ABC transporter substrate-binding protein [Phototrophicus methaneseepsis]|uniref:ABC transporter substrate-binding protein n=1 Tax=Phototrophicus methaneseepsis TaxID=2710758 RepID=A0A7S8ICH6_9CHLR|nr:ABC transporter substrate-binding protein [Phototrophicus methaneseepsis]QPC80491.1 ABC transporter substrate-binding protein [Phototrophicus methaneseepsis]